MPMTLTVEVTMPLPLAVAPPVAVLIAIGLFFLIRWWIGRTGAALLFTLSIVLNIILLAPIVLIVALAQEVIDLQQKAPTAPKALLVEKGSEVLLAVSFTEVKDLERGFSSFKPLGKEQVAGLAQPGEGRYDALTRDYYKVVVVKREFLEKLAAPIRPAPQGQPSQQDPATLQKLLSSARDGFLANDMDKVARSAGDLQKAFRDRGMNDAADLSRQIAQAARARDSKTLEALGPRLLQLASAGGIPGLPGAGVPPGVGTPALPVAGDIILKVVDAEDPAKLLAQYLPQQAIQEMSGGNMAVLKLALVGYLLQNRLQSGFDPIFLLQEYQNGDIQVYPATTISTLARLIPTGLPGQGVNPTTKP